MQFHKSPTVFASVYWLFPSRGGGGGGRWGIKSEFTGGRKMLLCMREKQKKKAGVKKPVEEGVYMYLSQYGSKHVQCNIDAKITRRRG